MAGRMMIDGTEALAAGKMVGLDNSFYHPPSAWVSCILIFSSVTLNFVLLVRETGVCQKEYNFLC